MDVDTHARVSESVGSLCELLPPSAACLHALCIVKIMLLLVDGACWRNDVVAARCVRTRYSHHHDWQCAHQGAACQPVAAHHLSRWLKPHTMTRAANQSIALL